MLTTMNFHTRATRPFALPLRMRWGVVALWTLLLVPGVSAVHAQGNVGIGTTSPDPSALLELKDTTRGVLVPRMLQAQMNGIVLPATGLLVYCTNSSPATFYYYNGVAWVPFLSTAWQLTGNAGTVAGTNFVGTTDNNDLVFKTNSVEGMRLTTGSNLGIGTAAPTSRIQTVAAGAKTAAYTGNLLTNTATTSTASITKYGAQVLSTGAWSGASDTNVGVLVNATGGTTNVSGLFQGGNVGINTTAPNTYLDINGDFATRQTGYTASNGANNDISIGTSSFVRLTGPTAAYSVTGIAGGVDGKWLTLFNSTTQQITISNESASSIAANRIWTLNSTGDVVINGKGALRMIYSSADSRWLVFATSTTVSTSSNGVITVKKPTDQSITSSTTLTNDNDLKIPINANDSMVIEGYLHAYVATTTPKIQIALTVPAGSSLGVGVNFDDINPLCNPETAVIETSGTSTGSIGLNAGNDPIHFWGIIITGATAGTIQLKWAQGTSSATATTLKAKSYMRGYLIR
ncbi:MAG TPA: hypothetical protein VFD13_07040 [Candidatus Kapabacteria bacterium]|nr:hypothetical protein [Candidatus Kapabacteria bacterium]